MKTAVNANRLCIVGKAEGYAPGSAFTTRAELHYITGNRQPRFSITAEVREPRKRDISAGGCMHREILQHWPDLADLVALHLSDMDGTPMHAEANGWYRLAGALGGMGERYHAGSYDQQHWKANGDFDGYRHSTAEECLQSFAEHCRMTLDDARAFAESLPKGDPKAARGQWRALVEAMRPRWKAEADAAIAKYGLTVTGDRYEPATLKGGAA